MVIKSTIQGLLIYGAMLAFLVASVALMGKQKKLGAGVYVAGFVLAVLAFVYRWFHAGHAPLQNLFEVFLCLGMLAYPISAFCRRFLGVGGEAADALVAFLLLFPAGFVFKAEPQKLPPALQSWLFIPHVMAYMFAYMILVKAAVQALGALFSTPGMHDDRMVDYERGAYRTVCFGFPLLTLGLILGAWWGKVAWGDYWNWDPKELWSLAAWLVYVEYFHCRYMFGTKHRRVSAALVVGGAVAILATLLWLNLAPRLFPGLHSYAS